MPGLTNGLRSVFERNSALGYISAGVCLLAVGYILFGSDRAAAPGNWYYDLDSGDVIAHHNDGATSPITLSNGHTAVLIHRFACGDCDDNNVWNGYLYKVTDQWREAQQGIADDGPIAAPTEGELVALVPEEGGEPQWFRRHDAQGIRIVDVRSRCQGEVRPQNCLPR